MENSSFFEHLLGRTEAERHHFILKKKDTDVLHFEITVDGPSFLAVTDIDEVDLTPHTAPWGYKRDPDWLLTWIERRFIPKNRRFVYELLRTVDISTNRTVSLLEITLGLSLTDDYWVVPLGMEYLEWKNYNLYQNDFSETLARVAFTGYNAKVDGIASSPEFTTDGALPKCWRRVDGKVYLYKGGTTGSFNAGLEPYSEFYAAQIAEVMEYKHVSYDLEKWHGQLSSVCPLFTSEDYSFVPMYQAFSGMNPRDIIRFLQHQAAYIHDLKDMMVFDTLILNHDRHLGNFGMIRDNLTGSFVAIAPIFDNGMSLLHQAWGDDFENIEELYLAPRTFTFMDLPYKDLKSSVFSLPGPTDRKKLRRLLEFEFKRHPQYNLPEERLKFLEKTVQSMARKLLYI